LTMRYSQFSLQETSCHDSIKIGHAADVKTLTRFKVLSLQP
jgi:hypothetical protein